MKFFSCKTALFSIAFLSILAFGLPDQGNRLLNKIEDKLKLYFVDNTPEKAFLETDKDMYVLGDTIWLKAYVVNGITHKTSNKSRVVYAEMLNDSDSIVEKRRFFVEGTSGVGDIVLSNDLKKGYYRLRAYTNYMLNDDHIPFFEKSVTVTTKSLSISEGYSGLEDIGEGHL